MQKKTGFMDGYKTYDTSNGFGSREEWQSAFEKRMHYKILTEQERHSAKDILQPLYDAKDRDSLRKAYYRLMLKYHPDRAGDTEQNKIIAQAINDTYFKLKNKY